MGPSLAVQCHLRVARTLRPPAAVVFFDLSAAFYSVAPEVAVGTILCPESRRLALVAAGLSEGDIAAFEVSYIAAPPALATQGASLEWVRVLQDWCSRTWFQVDGSSHRIWPTRGTKPGDR